MGTATLLQDGELCLSSEDYGIDIVERSGMTLMDDGLQAAILISLVGGNWADTGVSDDPEQWWGNCITDDESQKIRSRFLHYMKNNALTSSSRAPISVAASADLAWLKRRRLVTDLKVDVFILTSTDVRLVIEGTRNQEPFNLTTDLKWSTQNGDS